MKSIETNNGVKTEERMESVIKKLKQKYNISSITKIGNGGYGHVYEAKIENKRYAIKLIDSKTLLEGKDESNRQIHEKMLNNELFYSLMLNHKNCNKSISRTNFAEEGIINLLMEFSENSDLSFIIKLFYSKNIFKNISITTKSDLSENAVKNGIQQNDNNKIPEKNSWLASPTELFLKFFITQILEGLKYLCDCNLVHLDIKPKNLLLTRDFTIKLADFYTIKTIMDFDKIPKIGTRNFQSPEFFLDQKEKITMKNVNKIDTYGLGCILYYFLTHKNYFESSEFKNEKIIDYEYYLQKYHNLIKDIENKNKFFKQTSALHEFLKGLLNPDINERFDIKKALKHEWINKNENFKFYLEIHQNDSIKFLLELQKMEFSKFYEDRLKNEIFQDEYSNFRDEEIQENDLFEIINEIPN